MLVLIGLVSLCTTAVLSAQPRPVHAYLEEQPQPQPLVLQEAAIQKGVKRDVKLLLPPQAFSFNPTDSSYRLKKRENPEIRKLDSKRILIPRKFARSAKFEEPVGADPFFKEYKALNLDEEKIVAGKAALSRDAKLPNPFFKEEKAGLLLDDLEKIIVTTPRLETNFKDDNLEFFEISNANDKKEAAVVPKESNYAYDEIVVKPSVEETVKNKQEQEGNVKSGDYYKQTVTPRGTKKYEDSLLNPEIVSYLKTPIVSKFEESSFNKNPVNNFQQSVTPNKYEETVYKPKIDDDQPKLTTVLSPKKQNKYEEFVIELDDESDHQAKPITENKAPNKVSSDYDVNPKQEESNTKIEDYYGDQVEIKKTPKKVSESPKEYIEKQFYKPKQINQPESFNSNEKNTGSNLGTAKLNYDDEKESNDQEKKSEEINSDEEQPNNYEDESESKYPKNFNHYKKEENDDDKAEKSNYNSGAKEEEYNEDDKDLKKTNDYEETSKQSENVDYDEEIPAKQEQADYYDETNDKESEKIENPKSFHYYEESSSDKKQPKKTNYYDEVSEDKEIPDKHSYFGGKGNKNQAKKFNSYEYSSDNDGGDYYEHKPVNYFENKKRTNADDYEYKIDEPVKYFDYSDTKKKTKGVNKDKKRGRFSDGENEESKKFVIYEDYDESKDLQNQPIIVKDVSVEPEEYGDEADTKNYGGHREENEEKKNTKEGENYNAYEDEPLKKRDYELYDDEAEKKSYKLYDEQPEKEEHSSRVNADDDDNNSYPEPVKGDYKVHEDPEPKENASRSKGKGKPPAKAAGSGGDKGKGKPPAKAAGSGADKGKGKPPAKAAGSGGDKKKSEPKNKEYEKGGGKKHESEHKHVYKEEGEKKYQGKHVHSKHEVGHHGKEQHHDHSKDVGGSQKKHHHDDGYHGEREKADKGEKGAKYSEDGEHEKGHSTHGTHNIHKKDEFEKKEEFYDENYEGGDFDNSGGFFDEEDFDKGGHFKKSHKEGAKHHDHYGKKNAHEKGDHFKDDKGHKVAVGHDLHQGHIDDHHKKLTKSGHKKWGYHNEHDDGGKKKGR